jgi:hypothetical protein
MITYEKLSRRPSAFKSLTGMDLLAFDRLFEAFVPAHSQRLSTTPTKRGGQPRKRAYGGGPRFSHELRDRLVMALVWLKVYPTKVYPTYEVLGFFFSLAKPNARFNIEEILDTLEALAEFTLERPTKDRKKLRTVEAVMDAFPEVRLVIDSKEQRIRRPSGRDEDGTSLQRRYYSGKKKAHTLKTQIAVRPDGLIEAVSDSPPGSTHDLTLLRQTKLLERLETDEGAMMDKGYDGIEKDHPASPLYLPYKARRNRPLTDIEEAYNQELSSYRIVVEHTNTQLQNFGVLAQTYRHAREKHSRTFRAVAGRVNRQIGVTPLITYGAE